VPRLSREHVADGVMERGAALMFADISGYTRLSERLAAQGRVGAEIITTVVNECFTLLIDIVAARGGDVVRFGGDALFVVFTGDDRVLRAAVAAAEMQTALASIEVVQVPGGRVRLRMSIGLHDGVLSTYRWSGSWTEVIPYGPAVTEMARCESEANAGQVRVSDAVAAVLGPSLVKDNLLRQGLARRCGTTMPALSTIGSGIENVPAGTLLQYLPPGLRDMPNDPLGAEHRAAALSFVSVKGLDTLRSDRAALDRQMAIFDAVDDAAQRFGVVPLGTDVSPGGFKIILSAGVPRSAEDIEERMVHAARHVVAASADTAAAGVHSGLVFCGEVGHAQRHTFTVMGDAVNLTARLMAKAHAGEVVASRRLLDTVGNRFALHWQEPFAVKGKLALRSSRRVGRHNPGRPRRIAQQSHRPHPRPSLLRGDRPIRHGRHTIDRFGHHPHEGHPHRRDGHRRRPSRTTRHCPPTACDRCRPLRCSLRRTRPGRCQNRRPSRHVDGRRNPRPLAKRRRLRRRSHPLLRRSITTRLALVSGRRD
jgi:class 3 adenylate cyclase